MEYLSTDNPNSVIQPRRRGRPPKEKLDNQQPELQALPKITETHDEQTQEIHEVHNNNSEVEFLKTKNAQLEEENNTLKQLLESISITITKPLITCSDEDINKLYINYLTNKETSLDNCKIVNADDKLIVLKSYYEIG